MTDPLMRLAEILDTDGKPLFDRLRKDCPGIELAKKYSYPHVESCWECQGRNWVLADVDVGVLMVMADKLGWFVIVSSDDDVETHGFYAAIITDGTTKHTATAPKPLEVLIEALEDAVEARQEVANG